jgi:hypothetical protein
MAKREESRTAAPPFAASLGVGEDNGGTVKRALDCDEHAGGESIRPTTPQARNFPAYQFYAMAKSS